MGARYSGGAPVVRKQEAPPKPVDNSADIQRALSAIEKLCADMCQIQAAQGAALIEAVDRSKASGAAASQASTQTLVRLLRGILDKQRQGAIEFPVEKKETKKAVRFTVLHRDDKGRVVEVMAEESSVETDEEPLIVIEETKG